MQRLRESTDRWLLPKLVSLPAIALLVGVVTSMLALRSTESLDYPQAQTLMRSLIGDDIAQTQLRSLFVTNNTEVSSRVRLQFPPLPCSCGDLSRNLGLN